MESLASVMDMNETRVPVQVNISKNLKFGVDRILSSEFCPKKLGECFNQKFKKQNFIYDY